MRCPRCRGALASSGDGVACAAGHAWGRRDGFLALYEETEVRGTDRLLRAIYDGAPALHDPAVRWTFPLFGTGDEAELRAAYHAQVGWEDLQEGARVLDVGIGTGSDLPGIFERLRAPVTIWGVELSLGMLRRCRARLRSGEFPDTRLLLADVHHLPFPDDTFDRVLHVGALNSFRDPAAALAEMARVARPGAPIVVVDERLDPDAEHSALQRLIFRAICFYRPWPPDPMGLLPAGAADVSITQLGRYFFCLRFVKPSARTRSGTPAAAPRTR